MVGRGSAWEAASCTSRRGTPASRAAVMKSVPQRVRADLLADARAAGDAADDAGGAVPGQALPVAAEEQRALGALAGGQVDGAGGARREGEGDDLAALAGGDQGAGAAVGAHGVAVPAGGP